MPARFQSLRIRLLIGSIIPVALFLAAAGVSYLAIGRLLAAQKAAQCSRDVLTKAYDVRAHLAFMQSHKRAHHLLKQKEFRQKFDNHLRAFHNDLEILQGLAARSPSQRERIEKIGNLAREWEEWATEGFDLFARQMPFPLKEFQLQPARRHLARAVVLSNRIVAHLNDLIDEETTRLDELRAHVRWATTESIWTISLALISAVLLALVIPWLFSATILRPVNKLIDASDALRRGSFTTLTPEGPREIATLIRYFNMMGLALSEREEILRTAERRYQGLMGSLDHLLWSMDAEGVTRTDFASWMDYTGQTEDEVKGEGWLLAIHEEDRQRIGDAWKKALRDQAAFEEECRLRNKDGEYRSFSWRCVPIFDSSKRIVEWCCACTDTTARRKAEMLQRERDAAEAANRAKSQFLARMSHELRTPLNAIIGMSKMLSTQRFGSLNEKQADYVDDVVRAGEHLLELINDVLDLSRVEAGQMQVQPEILPLGPTVEAALAPMQPLAEGKKQTIVFDLFEREGEIETDPGRFKQVLINLVSNAVKYTPELGKITVRSRWVEAPDRDASPCCREQAQGVRLEVEDTGIGIPLEDQEGIWSEFQQASNRQQTIEGTGLGLALTRRLVHLLGGAIWLESTPGEGSCFSFTLPLKMPVRSDPELPVIPDDQPRPAEESGLMDDKAVGVDAPLALVIEDNAPTRKLLGDWLVEEGFHTVSAESGPEGLEQARRLRPQLILLDLRLPGADGWQVLTRLKSDEVTASIPVVIVSVLERGGLTRELIEGGLSGGSMVFGPGRHISSSSLVSGDLDERELAGNLDVVDWLVKPIDHDQFVARLRAACPDLFGRQGPRAALVVEDDQEMQQLLKGMLEQEGFQVRQAQGRQQALDLLAEEKPHVVVFGLLMEGVDCFAVIEEIREQPNLRDLPILVVTARELNEKETTLLAGQIQDVLAKGRLTQERLAQKLRELGLHPKPGSA